MKKMFLTFALLLSSSMVFAAPTFVGVTINCLAIHGIRFSPNPGVVPKKQLGGFFDWSGCGLPNTGTVGFQHGVSLTFAPGVSPIDDFNTPIFPFFNGTGYAVNYVVSEKFPCVFASYLGTGGYSFVINSGSCGRFARGAIPKVTNEKPAFMSIIKP